MNGMRLVCGLRSTLLLFAGCIAMPASGDDIYFTVDGAQQARIIGETTRPPEGMMRAVSFSGGIEAPFDAMSGQLTGKRRPLPVRVTREPGRGSPQLMHAMVTNETLKEVRVDFYALRMVNGAKVMSPYQTVKLTNAKLVGFKRTTVPATDLSAGTVRTIEELEFVYQRIELIDLERSVSAVENWVAQF